MSDQIRVCKYDKENNISHENLFYKQSRQRVDNGIFLPSQEIRLGEDKDDKSVLSSKENSNSKFPSKIKDRRRSAAAGANGSALWMPASKFMKRQQVIVAPPPNG